MPQADDGVNAIPTSSPMAAAGRHCKAYERGDDVHSNRAGMAS